MEDKNILTKEEALEIVKELKEEVNTCVTMGKKYLLTILKQKLGLEK